MRKTLLCAAALAAALLLDAPQAAASGYGARHDGYAVSRLVYHFLTFPHRFPPPRFAPGRRHHRWYRPRWRHRHGWHRGQYGGRGGHFYGRRHRRHH